MVIDHSLVHHPGLVVPVLNAQDISLDTVVEGAGRDLDFLLGAAYVVTQGVNFVVGHRDEVVGYEKGPYAHRKADGSNRQKYAGKRYAGRFHSQKFIAFRKIAQGHHRGKQGGKRKGERQKSARSPHHKFHYHLEAQTFTHKFIYVEPQELHHKDEYHNQQDCDKRPHEGFQYELVQFLHLACCPEGLSTQF